MKRLICLLLLLVLLAPAARAERLPDEQLVTYYNDSLFIGDSVIRMLRNYLNPRMKKDPEYFKGVRFFAEYNFRLSTAASEKLSTSEKTVNLVYKGKNRTMYQIAEIFKPPKIILLLGCNDSLHKKMEAGLENVRKIVTLMPEYSEGTQVIFLPLPPVTQKYEKRKHCKAIWEEFNERLKGVCEETGALFIDTTAVLTDEEGFMKKGISSDGEYHLNESGNALVVETLLDFAQEQYEAGVWKPAENQE